MRTTMLLCAFLLAVGLGCGAADVGESCDKSGDEAECVDTALCTADTGASTFTCRKRCTDQTQCNATTEACNGVSGSNLKTCQPK